MYVSEMIEIMNKKLRKIAIASSNANFHVFNHVFKNNEIFLNAQRFHMNFQYYFYFMHWDIGAFFYATESHECCPTVFHCCCNLKFQRARIGDSLLLVYRAAARNRVVVT